MIVYHSSKLGFLNDVFNGTIADDIDNAFISHLGRRTTPNEKMSWQNSMIHMYKVIEDNEIPDSSIIAIEYQIPLTSKRIDFIICGLDENKSGNIIIVELKQWKEAKLSPKSGVVLTRFQHGEKETTHPSYQAWSYAYMLENYNETIREKRIGISPCAYLHNYSPDNIINNICYSDYISKAPLFLQSDTQKLRDFIKKHIKYGPKDDIIWQIDKGKLRPSKQLADSLSSMLKGNQEFVLIDDKKIVYETALKIARESKANNKKVLIVEGGPGTGKSVVAINLLVQLTKERLVAQYVSKNAAPRDVYSAKLTGSFKKSNINNIFVVMCYNFGDRDINSVAAENAFYCLSSNLIEKGNSFVAPAIFTLMQKGSQLMRDKLIASWCEMAQKQVGMPIGMMFGGNPFTDPRLEDFRQQAINFKNDIAYHCLLKFYDLDKQEYKVPTDMPYFIPKKSEIDSLILRVKENSSFGKESYFNSCE